jgi:demethylmenaquinone methyltransferase / 2-methoxy-6-polyprenyl-1,4-benzoquinol methylase
MSETVRTMFADIAPSYDVGNTVLSFGIHHLWRRVVVRLSEAKAGMSVLDCATGTGDLALAFKKAVGVKGSVLGTDFCAEMMETAPQKALKRGLDIRFEVADAMQLPYADNTFDIASISFGIRNVDVPQQALREMARVVRPGGRVVVLEFGQPQGVMGALYRFYSNRIIPFVGGLLSGNREAYSYLNRTAAKFPSGDDFDDLMRGTGAFVSTGYEPLTFGIAFVYVGEVRGMTNDQ